MKLRKLNFTEQHQIFSIDVMKFIFLIIFLIPTLTYSHSGGTNSEGCHNQTGGSYHCHNDGDSSDSSIYIKARPAVGASVSIKNGANGFGLMLVDASDPLLRYQYDFVDFSKEKGHLSLDLALGLSEFEKDGNNYEPGIFFGLSGKYKIYELSLLNLDLYAEALVNTDGAALLIGGLDLYFDFEELKVKVVKKN